MMDTMVMDNDEARKRHGVQPTYKKVKGFQPLQIIWGRRIVDAVFRGGKKHSNHGNTAINTIRDLAFLIRKEYSGRVPIIVRLDAGFFDEALFKVLDELAIGFICGGKMYAGVKEYARSQAESAWKTYDNGHRVWSWLEWGYRCDSWKKFYRAIYTRPLHEDSGQGILDFAAKIVKTGREITLKVSRSVMKELRFDRLWERCQHPPRIPVY